MELRHIRVFLVLAEELHFGRTAARLRLAQSAVSQTIKNLEEEVGTTLLARTRRRVELTPAGTQFVEHGRRVLAEVERATSEARKAAAGESGRLVLRFSLMSALTALPRAIARYQREYPRVQLTIEPGWTTDVFEALGKGRCDLGFVSLKGDISPLASEIVEQQPLVVLLPRSHRLAGRKRLPIGALAGEKLLFLKQVNEPQIHAFFRRRCREAGFEPEVVLELEQLEVLLAFVAAGVGLSCAPAFVSRLRFPGVACVPLHPRVTAGLSAVWDPRSIPETARRFLAILREENTEEARGA